MFTTLKYRRQVAVLAALAMVASVLVVAPAVAADPKPDYTATFDACVGAAAESAGFEDVPANHANAGDIDCIAYYGITRGTSPTTYSPTMSVTREHMALFLTRLAGLVGIEMTSTPADAGFSDTGDLPAESQTAINQLADLGITQGTSATTYSPGNSVTRGQMALFISRLMNNMDPAAGAGHIPDDVVKNEDDSPIGSPYTDLGSATKSAYDAITQLYELGVVSGISATAYGPSALITRAAMAEFMAGVLDHSNTKPAGLSIQATRTSGFGAISDSTVLVSYRDDDFAPMEGVPLAIFSLTGTQEFEDGACPTGVSCDWSENSDPTEPDGNLLPPVGTVADGTSVTWYAWMGDADNKKFNVDTANAVSVKITSSRNFNEIGVSSDANKNAGDIAIAHDATGGPLLVNLDADRNLTITAQLQYDSDTTDATNMLDDVARPGVDVTVGLTQEIGTATVYQNPSQEKLTTDSNGKVTFTLTGPSSTAKAGNDPTRDDTVTFTYSDDGGTPDDTADDTTVTTMAYVRWQDAIRAATTAVTDLGPKYQVIDTVNGISFRVTVSLFDQYGDPIGSDDNATVTVGSGGTAVNRNVNNRGVATYSATVAAADLTAGADVNVTVTIGSVTATAAPVTPVNKASATVADGDVTAVYKDDDAFLIGGNLYSYDSDDTFLMGSKVVDMAAFEKELDTDSTVDVLVYDDDGASIFRIQ